MQKPWSLYNKVDKLRVDDLTSEQVRIVLLATASSRMSHWYACQEGDVHWQPISAIPEFYEDVRQIKGAPAESAEEQEERSQVTKSKQPAKTAPAAPPVTAPVQRRPMFEDAPDDATATALQVDYTSSEERRTARRYPRELSFKLLTEGNIFLCHTVDISMTGLSLEQDLPAWAPKNFVAELSFNNNRVKVSCSKISGKKLKFKDASSWDVIRAWIVNW